MVQTNLQQITVGLLALNDKQSLEKVRRYLVSQAHYDVYTVTTVEEAWALLVQQEPDVLLAEMDVASNQLFQKIFATFDDHNRPILIMLAESHLDGLQEAIADLVIPPTPQYIDYALSKSLRERKTIHELKRQNHVLSREVAQFQQLLNHYETTTGHVELLKDAVIHNVSHELKTPLLHVKSAVKLLAEELGHTTLTGYALDATARLEGVVKNITLLAEGLDVTLGPIIIRESIDYALRNLRRSWEHKDAYDRVVINLPEHLPPARGDNQGIGIVLQLLLDNALKFSDDVVQVSVVCDGETIVLTVHDSGIGIPNDKFEDIFKPFVQVDSSSTRRYRGIGVGLAIVRLILQQHGCSISVRSEEGRGSWFSFALPVVQI